MSINLHQPFVLLPNRVWRTYSGGRELDRLEGKSPPADSHFPEDWIGSATRAVNPGREQLATEGLGKARSADGKEYSMMELYTAQPDESLGAAHVKKFGAQPQLLVKLLDAAMRLHIQAHPTVAWAQKHLNAASGKTEAWWVLGARDAEAYVYFGFQRPPAPRAWRRMVAEQDVKALLACFDKIPVQPGDVLLIEGGVPHAIGPGLFILEVQEPTDYVVRCEYAHGGVALPESARTMGLGIDKVLDMFDYTAWPGETVKQRFGPRRTILSESATGKEEILLAAPQTDRLEARQLVINGALQAQHDGRYSIMVVLQGAGRIVADGVPVEVRQWSRVWLPACVTDVRCEGQMELARLLPPQS
jgi:mannose-6-phosphate isomerase